MNQFNMDQSTIQPGCRFNGALAADVAGRLYDARLRQQLAGRGLSGRQLQAIEAMAALRVTAHLSRQKMDRWAEKHGLSEGRLQLLFQLLSAAENRLPLGELADNLEVTPRNVTGLIDHLERDGLVERVDDPQDRRSTYASLTAAGLRLLQSMREEAREWQMKMASGLTGEELEQLRHVCWKLTRSITGAPVAEGRTA